MVIKSDPVLDDIVVFSKATAEHYKHIEIVLQLLRDLQHMPIITTIKMCMCAA